MSATPGVWTHVAYTYDGSTVKGYVDGVERLSVADAGGVQPRGNSLRLGVDGAYQQFFNGAIDDLRIYGRALTAAEVRSAMQTPVGVGSTVAVPADPGAPRARVTLSANVPNPFSGGTRIAFALPAPAEVDLRIFDAAGRLVRTLATGPLAAGRHEVEWDGADARGRAAPSGRYLLRLRAGGSERAKPILLIR